MTDYNSAYLSLIEQSTDNRNQQKISCNPGRKKTIGMTAIDIFEFLSWIYSSILQIA